MQTSFACNLDSAVGFGPIDGGSNPPGPIQPLWSSPVKDSGLSSRRHGFKIRAPHPPLSTLPAKAANAAWEVMKIPSGALTFI